LTTCGDYDLTCSVSAARRRVAAASVLSCRWFSHLPAELEQAKAHCRECARCIGRCLAGAVKRGAPCGVWGGEILHEGMIITRERPREAIHLG
jgi:Transcription factor WhiB